MFACPMDKVKGPDMTYPDILAIGEPIIEFNQTQPSEPFYRQGFDGDTSNIVIAAARQGAQSGYMTKIGDDAFRANAPEDMAARRPGYARCSGRSGRAYRRV